MGDYSCCTSLGGDCQVGWQIRKFFNNPIPSPFDWLVTPFDSLLRVLDDKGARFSRSVSVLPAMPPYTKESTICDDYGCSYHHDFKHGDDGHVIIDEVSLLDTRNKMMHKWNSFSEIVSRQDEVLFVHLGSHKRPPIAWPYLKEQSPLKISCINELKSKIDTLFPNTRCKLLQVYYEQFSPVEIDAEVDNNVFIEKIDYRADLNWDGDDAEWRRILAPFSTMGTLI